MPGGKTEIPFEFPLQAKGNKVLYETYHGVFVNIQVTIWFTKGSEKREGLRHLLCKLFSIAFETLVAKEAVKHNSGSNML